MIRVSSCSCLCPILWSQVLSGEWRCSWSSADGQCSNYIWVINNLIAYWGVAYIRDLTVLYIVGLLGGCRASAFINATQSDYIWHEGSFHIVARYDCELCGSRASAIFMLIGVDVMEYRCSSGPVFCLLLRVSSGCARPITGQVTSVTWPVIGGT